MNMANGSDEAAIGSDGDGDPLAEADALFDEIAGAFWEDALRFACDLECVSERCGRRACRNAGSCQLKWTEGKPVVCEGGVSDEMIFNAVAAIWFGTVMVMRLMLAPAASQPARRRLDG